MLQNAMRITKQNSNRYASLKVAGGKNTKNKPKNEEEEEYIANTSASPIPTAELSDHTRALNPEARFILHMSTRRPSEPTTTTTTSSTNTPTIPPTPRIFLSLLACTRFSSSHAPSLSPENGRQLLLQPPSPSEQPYDDNEVDEDDDDDDIVMSESTELRLAPSPSSSPP